MACSLGSPPVETIRPFIRSAFPLPLKRRHYNEDIHMDPYRAAVLHLTGGHRKGIREPLGSCVDRRHHLWCALKEDSPLSLETALPSDTIRAMEFIRSSPGGQICKIRGVQLRAAEEVVRTCASAPTRWNVRIPGSISASAGNFRTVAVKQMLHLLNIGGAAWVGQCAYGFPIAGTMSRKFMFPRGRKMSVLLPVNGIPDTSSDRSREWAAKSGMKNDAPS